MSFSAQLFLFQNCSLSVQVWQVHEITENTVKIYVYTEMFDFEHPYEGFSSRCWYVLPHLNAV